MIYLVTMGFTEIKYIDCDSLMQKLKSFAVFVTGRQCFSWISITNRFGQIGMLADGSRNWNVCCSLFSINIVVCVWLFQFYFCLWSVILDICADVVLDHVRLTNSNRLLLCRGIMELLAKLQTICELFWAPEGIVWFKKASSVKHFVTLFV